MTEESLVIPITAPPGPVLAKLGVLGSALESMASMGERALSPMMSLGGWGGEKEAGGPSKTTIKVRGWGCGCGVEGGVGCLGVGWVVPIAAGSFEGGEAVWGERKS